jgi:hypothetical protein
MLWVVKGGTKSVCVSGSQSSEDHAVIRVRVGVTCNRSLSTGIANIRLITMNPMVGGVPKSIHRALHSFRIL